MLIDYHVHLDKLDWSLNSIEEMCVKASDENIDRIGIVVHTKALQGFSPLYEHVLSDGEEHKKLKFDRDIDEYIKIIEDAKYLGYPVLCGIEVCYSTQGQLFLEEKLKQYPFDYKIGSVHLIDNKHFKTAIEYYKDIVEVGRMYYNQVQSAIESGLFNIIGHIEIARREGIPGLGEYPDILKSICDALIKNDCAVEINTKWLVKHGYVVPEKSTLKYMAQKGVKVVFSSDAHHKGRIGFAKDRAYEAILQAGFPGFYIV